MPTRLIRSSPGSHHQSGFIHCMWALSGMDGRYVMRRDRSAIGVRCIASVPMWVALIFKNKLSYPKQYNQLIALLPGKYNRICFPASWYDTEIKYPIAKARGFYSVTK